MTAKEYPKKIYLQNEDGAHPDCDTYYGEGVTWCEDKINKDDVEYIRADLVNEKVRHIAEQAVDEIILNKKYTSYITLSELQEIGVNVKSRINELTQGE